MIWTTLSPDFPLPPGCLPRVTSARGLLHPPLKKPRRVSHIQCHHAQRFFSGGRKGGRAFRFPNRLANVFQIRITVKSTYGKTLYESFCDFPHFSLKYLIFFWRFVSPYTINLEIVSKIISLFQRFLRKFLPEIFFSNKSESCKIPPTTRHMYVVCGFPLGRRNPVPSHTTGRVFPTHIWHQMRIIFP